jgi:hypothetical protein
MSNSAQAKKDQYEELFSDWHIAALEVARKEVSGSLLWISGHSHATLTLRSNQSL